MGKGGWVYGVRSRGWRTTNVAFSERVMRALKWVQLAML